MKSYRPLLLLPLAVALLVAVTGRIDAQSFTLEQVMSSPFPSDLTVSKRGDKVAWAFDAEGKRNIWIAEAPAFTARPLTHYDKDDGQELSDPTVSPNGNALPFVRGGAKNQEGQAPNPASRTARAPPQGW